MGEEQKARASSNLGAVLVRGLVTWLACSLILGFIVGRINLPKYLPLAQRGLRTNGVVSAKEPANHQTIHYTYEVGGLSYSGSSSHTGGNPDFKRLSVGDSVLVTYDEWSPQVSVLGDAKLLLRDEEVSVGMVAVLFPTIIVIVLYVKGVLPRNRRVDLNGDA
jgi:hypothetical protein